jgi:hypothetical protein
METPQKQALCIFNQPFNMDEFFSEPNNLDSLAGPIPCWNKDNYKDDCSIDTVAFLHILQNSNLNTKDLKIFDTTCRKGHTTRFLAQNAKFVHGYDDDDKNLQYAQENNPKLRFIKKGGAYTNFYDLIIGSTFTTDIKRLRGLSACLVPHGEIFFTFVTQSNSLPITIKALEELLPKIDKAAEWGGWYDPSDLTKQFTTEDKILKNIIKNEKFDIISYEQKTFDILILDKDKFKKFHKSLFMEFPFIQKIRNVEKREKLAQCYINKLVAKIKKNQLLTKDQFDYWFYPIDTTVIHIRKK